MGSPSRAALSPGDCPSLVPAGTGSGQRAASQREQRAIDAAILCQRNVFKRSHGETRPCPADIAGDGARRTSPILHVKDAEAELASRTIGPAVGANLRPSLRDSRTSHWCCPHLWHGACYRGGTAPTGIVLRKVPKKTELFHFFIDILQSLGKSETSYQLLAAAAAARSAPIRVMPGTSPVSLAISK